MAIDAGRMLENYEPDTNGGCWLWRGSKNPSGYGKLHDREARKGYSAHRFFYEHHVRRLAPDEVLMHKCDNRICVNPNHLVPGSISDNARDAAAKGRVRCGSGYRRPSQAQKTCMKSLVVAGVAVRAVARIFSVDPKTVRRIARIDAAD